MIVSPPCDTTSDSILRLIQPLFQTSRRIDVTEFSSSTISRRPLRSAFGSGIRGRTAWLFVGSPMAGRRAATLMTLIARCKANTVEPWAWLRDVLTELPRRASPEDLLPDRWLQ